MQAARQAVRPETVAKILFTSGSTGSPKGVLNTQGMLCAAVQAVGLVVAGDQVPVILDWLPWHHTVGGNATLHGVLRDGGSLFIDDGWPTPANFARSVENIRQVRPTSMLSLPSAIQMLADMIEVDDGLRLAFISRLRRLSYAGASLPQAIWNRIQALALRTLGAQIEPEAYAVLAERLAVRLRAYNQGAGGNTHRVQAFRILHTAASIGAGETTDMGYVNQRGVLSCRAGLVDELYCHRPGSEVIQL